MKYLPYILALAYAAIVLILFPKWTVDDAFITYRYAENLAHHSELTWNVGEEPVEGYTGVALPVLVAASIKLGGSAVVAGKLIGVGSFFMAALMLALCLRTLRASRAVRAVALLLYLTSPIMFTHALSGLETQLFSASILACLYALLRCLDPERNAARNECLLAILLLIAGLVRPEGVALALVYAPALAIVRSRSSGKAAARWWLRFGLLYLLPGVLYFTWRIYFYGRLLPNPFYVKASPGLVDWASVKGLGLFLYSHVAASAVGALLMLGAWLIRNRKSRPPGPIVNPRSPGTIAAASTALFVLIAFAQYCRSVPIMNYSHRFFAPYLPMILVGLGALAQRGFVTGAFSTQSDPFRYRIATLAAIGLISLQLTFNVAGLGREIDYAANYKTVLEDEHIAAARFLKANVDPSEWLIVVQDAGAIPYYSGLKTADFGGLNDRILAGHSLSPGSVADYFFSIDAAAAVFTSRSEDHLDYTEEAETIASDRRFDRYVLARTFHTDRTPIRQQYFQFVYLREDLFKRWSAESTTVAIGIDSPAL